ncbi:Retrovirus-related Pol polyprotein from type-2 retrotransposable element R2DM [Araneus ventricosus]|uniref:Retrovirus-related Pol polyprotein from type-2 retrotransposable element R2DM n=1 Tax=Araneus ventricosus TaxID=182803 RepID=A0A4Y2D2V7_ARAVE|nr:Retrovirus-related Pol polyprotein from type-2 retrotransposable element R2DM [Araneus ventricosus]
MPSPGLVTQLRVNLMTTSNTNESEVTAVGRDLSSSSGQGADAASLTIHAKTAVYFIDHVATISVLAKRLMTVLDPTLDLYQFGFRQMDGIAEAVHLFDQMIQSACTNFNTIAVAVLDMEKAFDSVSHDAIFQALEKVNISPVIKDYLKFTYSHARTFLCFNGSIKSEPVRPTRGVRQGDPMSPLLFLIVFDRVLSSIPDYEGFHIEGKKINHIAFADDLVLMADSMIGLNNIINKILPALTWSGLNISVEKSATFMWMADGKRKRVVYDSTSRLKIRNRPVNIFKVDDEFKYLGVIFTPRGRIKYNVDLELSFANLYAGSLRKLDVKIRRFVRAVLHLPKDHPSSAFHARVSDGGLGIPSLRWMAPLLAVKRGNEKEHKLLNYEGKQLRTANAIYNMFKRQWQSTCDGCGLKGSGDVPSAHSWVLDGTSLLSSRDYISCIHVRLGVLFNRARAARGRDKQHLCARGCYQPETLNHIIQSCYATHGARINRHNNIAKYLARIIGDRGATVHEEPHFQTETAGLLKPDLVIYTADRVVVVDVQVINDQYPLGLAHINKIEKYKEHLRPLLEGLRPEYHVTSFTMNWRGVLAEPTIHHMTGWGYIRIKDIKILSIRALMGATIAWNMFSNMTSRKRLKKGVG